MHGLTHGPLDELSRDDIGAARPEGGRRPACPRRHHAVLPIAEGRAAYDAMTAGVRKLNEPVARVDDQAIPGSAGDVPVRVYTPPGTGPFPVLLYIHGGGWVIGSRDSHDDLCRSLCHRSGALVVSVDYRRAPKHKFEDCYAALRGYCPICPGAACAAPSRSAR